MAWPHTLTGVERESSKRSMLVTARRVRSVSVAPVIMPTMSELRTLLAKFPRLGLANLPTPLQPLERLSSALGGPKLWVKRDDATGLGMGGNKLRKLDYVLRQAVDGGCDSIVSGGVVQSNSQRQVAAAAAKLGLECHLAVFHGRLEPPTAEYMSNGNALLNHLFGAKCYEVPWTGDRNAELSSLSSDLESQGKQPFVVPYGVSDGLGAVGYASAAVEIAEQSNAADFTPAAIVHCTGSGGTQAGLTLGASRCLPQTQIVGIDIDAEPERVRSDVVKYGTSAADLLGTPFDESAVEVVAGFAGPGYGVPDAKTIEAIQLAGRTEALIVDPVYSGKGLAGLIALIRAGRWAHEDNVIFLHTGGEPALFAYREALRL